MSLKKQATSGIFWTFAQQFGTRITNFVVMLVLARILLPSDFGMIAVFGVVIGIGRSFIDSGMTNSLIRTNDTDDKDLSTVFFFNLGVSLVVYLIIALTSPWIAQFFKMPELTNIIRIYSLILPIGAFSAIQRTNLTKQLDFKTQLKVELPSLILSGVAGVVFALLGHGAWSLVYMALIQSFLASLQYWFYSKWRPHRVFDKVKFKYHFNFGYKLALSGLIDNVFQNIYTVVIGKLFSATQLGYYEKANTMQSLPVFSITTPLNRVTFPLFAKIKDDNTRLKSVYKLLMKTVIFVIAPLLTLLGVMGEPLFRFLFTEKWLPAVPFFQILCIVGVLLPIHSYNLNILQVKGRSDLFLKLEIIKKTITVIAVAVTFKFGVIGLLWGRVATSFIALAINCHYSGKFLNYGLYAQLKDITPNVVLSLIAGAIVFFLDYTVWGGLQDILRLLLGSITGTITFAGLAFVLKFEELFYLKNLILKRE